MKQEHTVKSFDEDLETLRSGILRMGGMVEMQLSNAIEALARRDEALAHSVIEKDAVVDDLEHELQEQAIRVLALRQPMAVDLREAVSAFKLSSDLERMGDHAVNIAKRVPPLAEASPQRSFAAINRMARMVQDITRQTLDAFSKLDPELARVAWLRDEEVDDLYNSLFRELLTYMMEDPRTISTCTHLLFIAKNVERMGDHTTNIAESIIYIATGERADLDRSRSDDDAFYHLTPIEGEAQDDSTSGQ